MERKIVVNTGTDSTEIGSSVGEPTFISAEELAKQESEKDDVTDTDDKPDVVNIDDKEYILDEKGNAVNEDGTVFKTKEELESLNEEGDEEGDEEDKGDDDLEQVEIDGETFTINEAGDAIDSNGEVKYTKDQLSEMEEDSDEPTGVSINSLIEKTAITPYDENGQPIVYTDDEEGQVSYINDVYQVGQQAAYQELYNAYPEVQQLVLHLNAGGNVNDFKAQTDYSKIKLDKENAAQLKDIIYKARYSRGDRQESIDRYYKAITAGDKDNDNLYEEAETELQYLIDKNEQEIKSKQKAIEEQNKQALQQEMDYWGVGVQNGKLVDLNKEDSVYSILTKSKTLKLKDKTLKIPDKIRVIENGKPKLYTPNDIFSYLYDPITVNIGGQRITTTKHDLDLQAEQQAKTIYDDLYSAIRRFTKYDDTQFIAEQVNRDKVNKIRKLKIKKSSSSAKSKGASKDTTTGKKIIIKTN